MPCALAAPDKFRGSATAEEVAAAIESATISAGWRADCAPMADGGEGTLEVLKGRLHTSEVTGPLGVPTQAKWLTSGSTAVIEMAQASGMWLVGDAKENDPLRASTTGTGELISLALKTGATEIVVGMGGSATTDGGLGCLKALWPQVRLNEVELIVAVDVQTLFVDAARVFAPQKGASEAQVELLTRRLQRLAEEYEKDFGVDVRNIPGSGAAGGLAGGLAAIGGEITSGFDYLAERVELDLRVEQADIVITGEGTFDAASLHGKVVGGVIGLARRAEVPCVVIAGSIDMTGVDDQAIEGVRLISLVELFGEERSMTETAACVGAVVATLLSDQSID